MKGLTAIVLAVGLVFIYMGCCMLETQEGSNVGYKTETTASVTAVETNDEPIAKYMDRQAEEVKYGIQGAKVERVGEGEDAKINITFDSGVLFDVDSAELKPDAISNLNKLAEILQKYPDTNILIEGHTDSAGNEDHNMKLSEKRAKSVQDYLVQQKIASNRMTVKWYGESKPVASNDTEEGKRQNRRVEISIAANEKLKMESAKFK